ncbi:hypothetical protein V5O48_003349 [Marasmius crinis-equi]|uniref:Uncharacterized protein n=1 Tax=Marasmius crinis-equi TaxID=585013 RepID=A0ABR3FU60_9AGAR
MSAPNRFAKTCLWRLHDAPDTPRPRSFDEHQNLAFQHLARAQFLFSTLLKGYPDDVPSPLKTLVKDVIEEIPLEIQAVQPYLSKLLYKMVYTARVKPVKIVECINPGAPSSSPVVAQRGGTQLEEIDQLQIPESNPFPHEGRPFTLTQTKTNSLRPLIDMPFIVKFTPTAPEQKPTEVQVGIPDRHKAAIAASAPTVTHTTATIIASQSSTSMSDVALADAPVAPSTPVPPPLIPAACIAPASVSPEPFRSSPPRVGLPPHPKKSTAHVWRNPSWQELVRKLPHLRYTLTPPPESERASIPPDVLPGNEHLLPPPSPKKGRPLRRENAFCGPSNPEIFWDPKSWGPKPPVHSAGAPLPGHTPRLTPSGKTSTLNFGSSFRSGGIADDEEASQRGLEDRSEEIAKSVLGGEDGKTDDPDDDFSRQESEMEVDENSNRALETDAPEAAGSSSPQVQDDPVRRSLTSSPSGSSNLRGTLRRGLKVAYKAFGLDSRKAE